jgi:hypothetical protein
MHYVLTFFAGAFLCNCIPQLSSGLRGAPFPTPFAKPRGVGNSPPFLNFLWGSFNLFIGIYVLSIYPVVIGPNPTCLGWLPEPSRWVRICLCISARSFGTRRLNKAVSRRTTRRQVWVELRWAFTSSSILLNLKSA